VKELKEEVESLPVMNEDVTQGLNFSKDTSGTLARDREKGEGSLRTTRDILEIEENLWEWV
jgi:hypothetical protein